MAGKADRDVTVDILARDKTANGVRGAERGMRRLKGSADQATRAVDKHSKASQRLHKAMSTAVRTVGRATATMASLASLTGPATMGLLALGRAAAATGKALAGLAPLAAFLPSLAAAGGLLVGTLKAAAPGLAKALTPVTRFFVTAEGEAGKLTKRIQELASAGVKPLAERFAMLNMPTIAAGMENIARATNRVVVNTGRWLNTTEGQRLIRTTTEATAKAAAQLAPKVTAAAIAMGRLANRAGDRAITGLTDLISRILDRFTAWANSTSIADINSALRDLSGWGARLKSTFAAVRDIGAWLGENEGKVRAFATALGALGVAIGVMSGHPMAVVIGALSLVVTNWDRVKSSLSGAAGWWAKTWSAITNHPAIRDLVRTLIDAFNRIRPIVVDGFRAIGETVMPKLREIKQIIMTEVVPALTAFIAAIAPVVAWLLERLMPVVSTVFGGILTVIKGALKVIAGILNVFAGLITGDWSRMWQGIKQIASGAWNIIKGGVQAAWSAFKQIIRTEISATVKIATTLHTRILDAFKGAGTWLKGVGSAIVDGLADAIAAGWRKVSDAIGGLLSKAKNALPGWVQGALGFSADVGGWRPARLAAQFAGGPAFAASDPGWSSRTGGPMSVHNRVEVLLDGRPFYAATAKAVRESEDRTAWRSRLGRR